jgi:hypothetical protein
MKLTFYSAIILTIISCGQKTHKEKVEQDLKEKIEIQDKAIEKGKQDAQNITDSILGYH